MPRFGWDGAPPPPATRRATASLARVVTGRDGVAAPSENVVDMADLIGPVVVFGKAMFVAFLIFWFRFTYPRFREDQLQAFAWKFLIPLSLLNIAATGILKVVF